MAFDLKLNNVISEKDASISEQDLKIKTLTAASDEKTAQLKEKRERETKLSEEIMALESAVEELKTDQNELKRLIASQKKTIQALNEAEREDNLRKTTSEYARVITLAQNNYQKSINSHTGKINALESSNASLLGQLENLKLKLAEKRTEEPTSLKNIYLRNYAFTESSLSPFDIPDAVLEPLPSADRDVEMSGTSRTSHNLHDKYHRLWPADKLMSLHIHRHFTRSSSVIGTEHIKRQGRPASPTQLTKAEDQHDAQKSVGLRQNTPPPFDEGDTERQCTFDDFIGVPQNMVPQVKDNMSLAYRTGTIHPRTRMLERTDKYYYMIVPGDLLRK